MKAGRLYGSRDVRIDEIDEPKVANGQVLVEVEWCGICGTDLHEFLMGPTISGVKGDHQSPDDMALVTLGHEFCGRVRDPPANSRFRDGDAVMVDPRISCHDCGACQAGQRHCCARIGYVGLTTRYGGFGEKVAVAEDALLPLPDQISLSYAAVIEPLAVARHAVAASGVKEFGDKTVLVMGAGPIGFALVLILKAFGVKRIIISEPAETRRRQVNEFCVRAIDPIAEQVDHVVQQVTKGQGVDVVFDCAGAPAAVESGMNALRFQGTYVIVAAFEKPAVLPTAAILGKELVVKGSVIFADGDMEEVIQMMAVGHLQGYEKMVTGRIPLHDLVDKGFHALIHDKDEHVKILVHPG